MPGTPKTIEFLKHDEATRENIPTAEYQSVWQKAEQGPVRVGLRGPQPQPAGTAPPSSIGRPRSLDVVPS